MQKPLQRLRQIVQTPVLLSLFVIVTVLAADWASIEFTKPFGRVAAIWLANGIVVVLLVRLATGRWWSVLVSAFLANMAADLLSGDTVLRAVLLSIANTVEVILVAGPLRLLKLDDDVRSVRAVIMFFCLALGPAVLASGAIAALALSGSDSSALWKHFYEWYAGDVLGLVLVVPIGTCIHWREFLSLFDREHRSGTLAGLALNIVVLGIVLAMPQYPLKYLLVPAILYLTFLSDYAGAVLGMSLVGGVMLAASAYGGDYISYGAASPRSAILLLQLFLIILNITALSASAQVRTRRLLEQELREAMRRAETAREAAEAASRAKSQFLGNMSHELRTPLNAILGFSSLMRSSRLPNETTAEYAGDIHDAGSHLLDLITDLLDISKIEAGKRELDLVRLDLREPVGEAVAMTRKLSDSKKIMLVAELPDYAVYAVADRRAVKQIALNLLSNAVKFTNEGGEVRISLGLTATGVCLAVKDTGIGIPAEFLPRIGSPFEQAASGPSRKTGGTGLGVALVKSLAQLHGGTFSIDSTEHVGTIASVFLPRAECERGAA